MKRWLGYEHGINLGGWLSQCDHTKERYDNFIKEDAFKQISEWGLDHVRIPIDYNLVETKEGDYIEEGFHYIDLAVQWSREYNLNMILDLHKTFGFSFDEGHNEKGFFENEDYQERFYRLWEEFARRYGNVGEHLAFEILNEVTNKEYCDLWNEISKKCITKIRAIAPDVKILIGGYYNNSIEALPDLLPPYDENIIYNFHCYEPLIFTHQGAYWIPTMDTSFRVPVDAPYSKLTSDTKEQISQVSIGFDSFDQSASLDGSYFNKYFAEAVKIAEERNVALYCGEYGVIENATPEDTLKWYEIISKSFDKFGIGRAAWSYKEMDFGISDERLKDVRDELIKLL
jgi:Endoglucanase